MVDSRRPRLATSFNSELFSSHHIGVNHRFPICDTFSTTYVDCVCLIYCSLLVEEIDVGEAKLRQVVSGLAKHCSPDQLTNRHVVLITNVKPGKLRDVMSEGLVLCASNEDHTIVEPLLVPEGAKPGECVSFFGHEGKPEDVLNPKKKQLDKITPHLFTDDKGIATFKGIPFMTSSGPCASSIIKASIK